MHILMRLFYIFLFFSMHNAFANHFDLPSQGNAVVGDINYIVTGPRETLVSIGQKYNVGVNAMLAANPGGKATSTLPENVYIKVPGRFILPPGQHQGIVINLAEMRIYYYPDHGGKLMTFPIGIGKVGKTIPMIQTAIARKMVNPTWYPPEDIKEFNRNQGIELPRAMGPGPDNPLGPYGIYLKVPTYLIHSTIFPESIGTRASFGCIRMHENDIKEFFPLVQPGTPVNIINQPAKLGWQGDKLYLEAHQPLEEHEDLGIAGIVSDIINANPSGTTLVNWPVVAYLAEQRDGVPDEVGFKITR